MAGNLKGIVIEIGGDTTKLGKALSDVNSKTKSLQSELKGVNTLLKMDPGNVTLLTQKQDLLTQAIAGTKEKLDTLKMAQEQAQAQFERGEITEEQYRDLQREIVLTEQKLEGLTDELKNFGSVGAQQVAQVGEKVQEVGGKVEQFGKGFSVVSAGTGAILGASIVAFKELDEGYDTIVTKTGATGEALEGLNAVADNIFGSMPTDMTSVGTAVGEINTRFGYTGDELEKLSTQFIQFAEINGVDLNNSIGTVDKVLEQFNLDGKDASGVLDLITQKAQQTGIGADTLMNSIQQNGATFKDMGIGVNEAVVLMSQFEANGVNVETALKGLKKATSEYAEEGLSMEEGLSKTISSIKNAKTESEALAIAQEVFGTKGANEMSKAIREGRISVDDLSKALGDYGGTVSNTFEGTLDPIDQGTVAMNNLKLVGSELAGVLQATFAPMLTSLVEKLKNLATWFSNLSPGIQKIIVIVLSVVTALGPLIIIIGKLITSVGTIMTFAPKLVTAFNGIKTAFTALGTAFASNPIGIIIVAVTALVAVFIYLWNNCEAFRNFFINLWAQIKTAIQPILDSLVQYFKMAWEWIKGVWNTVQPYFMAIWEKIKAVFAFVAPFLSAYFKTAWELIKVAWSMVIPYFQNVWNTIKAVFSVVATYLGGMFKTAWEAIKLVWNVVGGYFREVWNTIKGIFSVVKNVLSGNWRGAWEAIKGIVSGWASYFEGVWTGIKNVFSSVKTWFSSTFSSAWNGIKSAFSGWSAFFQELWTKVKNAFKISNIIQIGRDLITGLWNGINDKVAWLKSKVSGVVNKIKSWFTGKDGFDEHSPSLWSQGVGEYIDEGLAIGIDNAKDKVLTSVNSLAEDTRTEVQKVTDEMNAQLLESEQKYADESIRLKESKSEADKQYLEDLKKTAETERKIYDAQQKDVENLKKTILNTYKSIADECITEIDTLQKAQETLEQKLVDYGGIYDSYKLTLGDETKDVMALADMGPQIQQLQLYNDLLSQVGAMENVPQEFFALLRDMSVDEGIQFAQTILKTPDEQFDQYIADWQTKQELAKSISKTLYQEEADELATEITTKFDTVEQEFFGVGENSATQFEDGFLAQLNSVIDNIKIAVQGAFNNLYSTISTGTFSVTTSLSSATQAMAKGGILTKPTRILAGEDGAEAIIPLEHNTQWIDAVARQLNDTRKATSVNVDMSGFTEKLDKIYERLNRMQIVLDTGTLVGETIDKIDNALADKQLLNARGV